MLIMLLIAAALFALLDVARSAPFDPSCSPSASIVPTSTYSQASLNTLPPRKQQPPLLPAVHWDFPKADIQNLAPQSTHSLYYSSDGISSPTLEHLFAKINTTLLKDAVVLDHSSYVESVVCQHDVLDITFTNSTGYNFAKQSWSSLSEFLLVTYSDGCGTLPDARSFWEVDSLGYDDSGLTVSVDIDRELGIADVLDSVDMTWGAWKPSSQADGFPLSWKGSDEGHCDGSSYVNSDGLPAVSCHDEHFDENLDRATIQRSGHHSPSLHRRGFFSALASIAHEVAQAVSDTTQKAITAVGNFASTAINDIKKAADIVSFSPTAATDIPIDVFPGADKTDPAAPWPSSVLLYNKTSTGSSGTSSVDLDVYCVNCHMSGSIHLAGAANFGLGSGLTALTADTNGTFEAQVAIGLVAEVKVSDQFEKNLVHVVPPPPAGFSIPGVISVGPYIDLTAKANFGIDIKGQALAGLEMQIPDFKGHLDFLDSSKSSSSGFTPQFTRIFNASGEITAYAGISLPVAIGLGVDIPAIKFKGDVELVDQPSLNAEFKYETDSDTCQGIDYNLRFENDLFFNAFNKAEFNLYNYTSPALATGCYSLGSSTTTTPVPSTSSTSTHVVPSVSSGPPPTKRAVIPTPSTSAGEIKGRAPQTLHLKNATFTYSDETSNDITKEDYKHYAQQAATSEQKNDNSTGAYPNGTAFINIQDVNSQYQLATDSSGNLRPADINSTITYHCAELNGVVYSDDDGRFFQYSPDTVAKYNVSRIRMTKIEDAPSDSKFVGLVPAPTKNDTAPYVYAAADADGSAYALVTCNYANGQASKIFISKAGDKGLKTLTETKLQDSVTGGKVTSCTNLGWAVPQGALGKFGS